MGEHLPSFTAFPAAASWAKNAHFASIDNYEDFGIRTKEYQSMFIQKSIALFVSVCAFLSPLKAQEPTDSIVSSVVENSNEQFKWQQLIAPTVLITVGSIGVNNGWFKRVNQDVRDKMSHLRGDCNFHADDYLQYTTAAGYLTIGFIPGNQGKHNFKERLCAGVTAYASMAILTNVTKYLVKEPRPDSGAKNSFPSGHTATAFTGAELMRIEYGPWIGLGGYALATGVAFLRLYNNRHWLNDVLAGAGIGILSAHIGYWLLPFERKLFHIKQNQALIVAPTIDNSSYGISLTAFL